MHIAPPLATPFTTFLGAVLEATGFSNASSETASQQQPPQRTQHAKPTEKKPSIQTEAQLVSKYSVGMALRSP